jgi:ribonucleotide monophosphatase NagD (HAD superfamily)
MMMSNIGVAVDIDGVLKLGKVALPGAVESLQLLEEHKIPYVLLTNGAGTEKAKAEYVAQVLDIPISPSRVIVSHSPLRSFPIAKEYCGGDGYLLVLAKTARAADEMCSEHGWPMSRVVALQRLSAVCPTQCPLICRPLSSSMDDEAAHTTCGEKQCERWESARTFLRSGSRISAIIVLEEPTEWGEGLQIIVDVLAGEGRVDLRTFQQTEFKQIPLYACNPDFDYKDLHRLFFCYVVVVCCLMFVLCVVCCVLCVVCCVLCWAVVLHFDVKREV